MNYSNSIHQFQTPRISVITINYNNSEGLLQTIRSVISQDYNSFEYIVIDGGSTDGSTNVLQQYSKAITRYVSEKDAGIYNAMNKGIDLAVGEYLLFLNSGDVFADKTALSSFLLAEADEPIIYGNLLLKSASGKIASYNYLPRTDFYEVYKESLPHPGTLVRKDVFKCVGGFSENDKITSDWQFFMLALFKYKFAARYVNKAISIFASGGVSNNPEHADRSVFERKRFMRNYFPEIYDERLFNQFSFIHRIKKRLFLLSAFWVDSYGLLKLLKKVYS